MSIAVDCLLAVAALAAWLGAFAFMRLRTSFERLHVVTFVNVAAGGPMVAAAFLTDGLSGRTLKAAFLLIAVLAIGALLAHVTGRALYFREGERR